MARFNTRTNTKTYATETNLAGGAAYAESPYLEFASLVLTSFVRDQFYRSDTEAIDQVSALLDTGVSPEFAAKAAVYARNEFNMRSITHVVAGELAHRVKGSEWMRPFVRDVIVRPDDMLEILAYHQGKYGRNAVPNALKRGMRDAFGKFDAYQLAKYRGESRDIKLVDVVNLVHPEPNDGNREALEALVSGTLRSTGTWESELTRAGQNAGVDGSAEELKAAAWADLVRSRKIGYMALVRNLRNILRDAPEVVDEATEMLVEPGRVRKSRMLPFRFATARNELGKIEVKTPFEWKSLLRPFLSEKARNAPRKLTDVEKVVNALENAADLALSNVPRFEGRTLVVVDESGSMVGRGDRTNSPIAIASLFAAVILKANPTADLMMFANRARYALVDRADSVLTIQREIQGRAVAAGTNFNSIFEHAERPYDRIIILSDMQGWMGGRYSIGGAPTVSFAKYRERVGVYPKVFSFDLAGYGTLMFPERNVYGLSGFSEKVFDVMALLERDSEALVHEIEAVELG